MNIEKHICRSCPASHPRNLLEQRYRVTNEIVRFDVRFKDDKVWLTQSQMATLFGCSTDNVGLHLKNVYSVGELSREATSEDFLVVRTNVTPYLRRRRNKVEEAV